MSRRPPVKTRAALGLSKAVKGRRCHQAKSIGAGHIHATNRPYVYMQRRSCARKIKPFGEQDEVAAHNVRQDLEKLA